MMGFLVSSVLMTFFFAMPFMVQPLSLGFIIILMALFWCILVGVCLSVWFSYIVFMIYVGAMLVMFIYVSSLVPNIKFKFGKLVFFMLGVLSVFFFIFVNLDFVSLSLTPSVELKDDLFCKTGLIISSVFNMDSLFGLILVLLFVLIVIVKICYIKSGALRRFSKN